MVKKIEENFILGESKLETGNFKTALGDYNKGIVSNTFNEKAADLAKNMGYKHGELVRYEIRILPKE